MPDRITVSTVNTGAIADDASAVVVIPVFAFGYIKRIVIVPRDGTAGTDWDYDLREINSFVVGDIDRQLYAETGKTLTKDSRVVDLTPVSLGDLAYDTTKDATKHNIYMQVTFNGTSSTDWSFDVRVYSGRQR